MSSYAYQPVPLGPVSPYIGAEPKQMRSIRGVEAGDFPVYEAAKDAWTKRICTVGLVCCWIAGISVTGAGIWVAYWIATGGTNGIYGYLPHMAAESIPLATNLVVTLLVETTGYIHTVSLRWSLQREGRLNFNSNLRLCTASKTCGPNKWYSNLAILASITMAYASSSLVFWHSKRSTDIKTLFSTEDETVTAYHIPLIALGLCFLTLAAFSTWALRATHIPCWSSSPLDTTHAALKAGNVIRYEGRGMRSVHDKHEPSVPAWPRNTQGSAWRASWEVRLVVFMLWTLVILCFMWAIIVGRLITIVRPDLPAFGSWSLMPSYYTSQLTWQPTKTNNTLNTLAVMLLFTVFQGPLTFGLHCAELQINLSRDEAFWRKATKPKGCQLEAYDSVKAAFTSWQSIGLSVFKTVLHWIFGLSVRVVNGTVYFGATQILYLALLSAVCAGYVTYITGRRPKGPQPAAYGHLQTLANLVDEWAPTIWWGVKDPNPIPAPRVGTASHPLPMPLNEVYL